MSKKLTLKQRLIIREVKASVAKRKRVRVIIVDTKQE